MSAPVAPPSVLRLATPRTSVTSVDPDWLDGWLRGVQLRVVATEDSLVEILRRSRPKAVIVDARTGSRALSACARCKGDAYTALVPCIAIEADADGAASSVALLDAGADEVLRTDIDPREAAARLHAAVQRAARDLAAQPTTGLPGPPAIDAFLTERLRLGVPFAACYADLDHFKEYNDRYGFYEGDRVIRMVARMLYDVALGAAGHDAFVGHIGGDDFLCVLPLAHAATACALMVDTFGVATTERRRFESAAHVSRLASEMKSFAKTLPGSVFAFDRRADDDAGQPTAPFAEIE